MNEFDEAFLGQTANYLNESLRDLKRSMYEQFAPPPALPYTPEQALAAQAVTAALAEVERAFAVYRPSEPISYCDCCTDPKMMARFVTMPRDDLSEDDVSCLAGSLLYTIGETNDLKYLVPRFCRDMLTRALYDLDSIFARFVRADFHDWPEAERRAVRGFLAAAWRSALLTPPRRNLSELNDVWLEIMDAMASLGFMDDALAIFDAEHGDSADARLLELVDRLVIRDGPIALSGAGGFANNGAAYDVLERWLRSPGTRARIDALLESARTADPALAERIDGVLLALASRPQP